MFPALPCAQEGAGALRSKASPGRRVLPRSPCSPLGRYSCGMKAILWKPPPHLPFQFLLQSRHCKSLGYQRNSSLEGLKQVTVSGSKQRFVCGSY